MTRSRQCARKVARIAVVIAALLVATACNDSPDRRSAATSSTTPPATGVSTIPAAATRVVPAALAYASGPANPRKLIAWSGRNALAIDGLTGDVSELIATSPSLPAYYVPYRFTPSPDGTRFAYTCRTDGSVGETDLGTDLCVLGADGPSLPPLIAPEDLPAGKILSPDAWSPDGRHLAFRAQVLVGPPDPPAWTFVFDFATSRSTRMFRGMKIEDVAWSPDGSLLAAANAAGVFVARPDTEDVVNVSAAVLPPGVDVTFGNLAWSPDGASIAFTMGETGHYADKLYVAGADGGSVMELGVGGRGVSWSPDGRWIARLVDGRSLAEGCGGAPCYELWVARAGGSDDRRLASGLASARPAWSPDSRLLAFVGLAKDDPYPRSVLVAPLSGGPPDLKSHDLIATGSPSLTWGSDQLHLFFTAYTPEIAGSACGQGGCSDGYLFMADIGGTAPPRQIYDAPVHEILSH